MIHKKKIASLILAAGLVAGFTAQSSRCSNYISNALIWSYPSMDIHVNLDDGINATSSNASALSPVNKAGSLDRKYAQQCNVRTNHRQHAMGSQ